MSQRPTPADNWNNDQIMEKAIRNNLTNTRNAKEALSRNRIRVSIMMINGCHYPTSFPISIVAFILQREAARRPNKKLTRFIDPCAGWGDRLAGAIICGSDVLDEYVGFDPWQVSHDVCGRVCQILKPTIKVELLKQCAEKTDVLWPDADLVFTSPPYAALECYNMTEDNPSDGQAWRYCQDGRFTSHFLQPMLQNAANATRNLKGRVIINMGNTAKKDGGETLTEDLVQAAQNVGLVLVETIGMKISVRASNHHHEKGTESFAKGEPIFVFEHVL